MADPILTEFSNTKSISMTQKSAYSSQICYVTFKDNVIPPPIEFSDPMKPKVFSTRIAEVNDEVQLRLSKVEDRLLAVRDKIKGILARINTMRPTLNSSSSTPRASVIALTHPDQRWVMRDSVRSHSAGSSTHSNILLNGQLTSSSTIIPAGFFDSDKDELTQPSKNDPSADKFQTATVISKRVPRKSCTPMRRQTVSIDFYYKPKLIEPRYTEVTPQCTDFDSSEDDGGVFKGFIAPLTGPHRTHPVTLLTNIDIP